MRGRFSASDGTQAVPTEGFPVDAIPTISADGRYVAYANRAPNLVRGDLNQLSDVFVFDRQTATTVRVSVASDGTEANGGIFEGAISADGHYVVFSSDEASNLVPGDTNGTGDVFVVRVDDLVI